MLTALDALVPTLILLAVPYAVALTVGAARAVSRGPDRGRG